MNDLLTHTDFLLTLFTHTREAIVVVNSDLEITAANPAASPLLGYAPPDLVGMRLQDLVPSGLPPEGLPESDPHRFQGVASRGDGTTVSLRIAIYPSEAGKSWLLMLEPSQETASRITRDLLKAERIKADALLEAIPDTILIQDFEGNFLDFYPAIETGLFLPGTGIKGRNMAEVLPVHVQELFSEAFEKIRAEGAAQRIEFNLETGHPGNYEARLVPMNDHRVLTIVRDVSQRMAYAHALEEERSRLRNYLDSAASMFVVLRPDYAIDLVNQKVCETLGYPRESLLNQNWLNFLGVRGRRKRLQMQFDRAMDGKTRPPEYFESHIRTRDGGKRLVRWRNAVLRDEHGAITGMVCSGVDITDQKTAEEGLRRSESTKRAILEAIPDVILLHDKDGTLLGVQEAGPAMAFFSDGQLSGKPVTEAFPGSTGEQMLGKIRESCRDGKPKELEFTLGKEPRQQSYEARYVCMDTDRVVAVVRDITRARAIQQVLDLRNRALAAAGNGILIADARLPDMPAIYCNDAFTRITQYEREEVIGRNCRFLQGDGTDPARVGQIREALRQGTDCRVVLRNYRKDGSLFWNELAITPICNTAGEATHFIGVISDVSDRVAEGERKDHTRQILEAITQDLPLEEITGALVGFLASRLAGQWIHLARWSPGDRSLQALSTHGMPPALDAMFRTISLEETAECPCRQAVRTKKPVLVTDLSGQTGYGAFTSALVRENIRSCWSYPILSSENTVLGTCTFFGQQPGRPQQPQLELLQDALQLTGLAIERHQTRTRLEDTNRQLSTYARTLEKNVAERTEEVESTVQKLLRTNQHLQKQIRTTREAEERALASQVLFAAIASNFPKGVIMVFDRQFRFVHLEGEELERIGLRQWDFLGRQVAEAPVFSTKQQEEMQLRIGQTLDGQHLSFEIRLGPHTYSVNSTPLRITNGTSWALLVFSNVTEHKRAEEDLLRALRIEQELNDYKSRFISMASHEFRTPLSAIQSSAILIGKQNDPGNEEKRLRYLRQIKNNVRNLVVILDDFLSLSKLEEGKMECQPTSFDILDLIRSVLEELESSLKVGQHFSEQFEMASLKVHLDPKLVRHILVNLLSNATKYSPEKSGIFIHIQEEGELLKIAVRDEGMGIPEGEKQQLFNRFFRARNADNIPGTGLGLHIVRNYTELMGGTITFESQLGQGSTFYLTLPVHFNPEDHEKDTNH